VSAYFYFFWVVSTSIHFCALYFFSQTHTHIHIHTRNTNAHKPTNQRKHTKNIQTTVILDATRPITVGGGVSAVSNMTTAGISVVTSNTVLHM
jgi:hypothetical protein